MNRAYRRMSIASSVVTATALSVAGVALTGSTPAAVGAAAGQNGHAASASQAGAVTHSTAPRKQQISVMTYNVLRRNNDGMR